MMERIKDISFYIVVGYAITFISWLLGSDFLKDYLAGNVVTILIALLAINTTTSSVVMTKLKELFDKTGGDFSATIYELKASIVEQIVFIVAAIIILILLGSKLVIGISTFMPLILNGLLVSLFVGGLHALFDTASSIFVILQYENKK